MRREKRPRLPIEKKFPVRGHVNIFEHWTSISCTLSSCCHRVLQKENFEIAALPNIKTSILKQKFSLHGERGPVIHKDSIELLDRFLIVHPVVEQPNCDHDKRVHDPPGYQTCPSPKRVEHGSADHRTTEAKPAGEWSPSSLHKMFFLLFVLVH